MGGPVVRDVRCLSCGADAQQECRTKSGKPSPPHRIRWRAWEHSRLYNVMIVEVENDMDELGLKCGEKYHAQAYRPDPGEKVTLLSRVPDGHDPECTLRWSELIFVRWAGN